MFPDEKSSGFSHGRNIKLRFYLPGGLPQMRRHDCAVIDQVFVGLGFSIKPDIKLLSHGFGLDNSYVFREDAVQSDRKLCQRNESRGFKTYHLSQRVDAGIGARSGIEFDRFFIDFLEGFFEFSADCSFLRLDFKTRKICAIVLNGQFDIAHAL